jgi:hypothetical protein
MNDSRKSTPSAEEEDSFEMALFYLDLVMLRMNRSRQQVKY